MSPFEAAALLGVDPAAPRDAVLRAYDGLSRSTAPGDLERHDALARARDVLLAAAPWPQQPGEPWPQPAGTTPQQPTGTTPQQPIGAQHPQRPGAPWPQPAPARRPLSTGAIIGIVLGTASALLLATTVAIVFAVGAIRGEYPATALPPSIAPADPAATATPTPTADPDLSGPSDPFEVDGVEAQYTGGWAYRLTSKEGCSAATVTFGFSTTATGAFDEEWSETVELKPGVPFDGEVPQSASDEEYMSIESITCGSA